MEQILDGFGGLLVSWGAPGLVIALLWLDRREIKAELSDVRKELSAVNEKRIAEGRETLTITQANSVAVNALGEIVKARFGKD